MQNADVDNKACFSIPLSPNTVDQYPVSGKTAPSWENVFCESFATPLHRALWSHFGCWSYPCKHNNHAEQLTCAGRLAAAFNESLPLPPALDGGCHVVGPTHTALQAQLAFVGQARVFRATCSKVAQPTFWLAPLPAEAGKQV